VFQLQWIFFRFFIFIDFAVRIGAEKVQRAEIFFLLYDPVGVSDCTAPSDMKTGELGSIRKELAMPWSEYSSVVCPEWQQQTKNILVKAAGVPGRF
jgi:hypothetical protein